MPFPNARSILYRYLLGEATDEEKCQVEERSLVDERYRKTLRENELELMAAYVYGHLTLDMRERFEKHFLNSEERVKSLGFAAALYERAKANAAGSRNSDSLLRPYLLGKLPPDEEVKVEEKLLIDDNYKRRLETAEHELIVDYTLENLTQAEREMFERHFLRFDGRGEKLRFAETVCVYYEYAEWLESKMDSRVKWSDRLRRWLAEPVRLSAWNRNVCRPIWQPLTAISIICVGALVWLLLFYESPITRGLKTLQATYAQERPIEARLTGFGYAAYRATQSRDVVKFYHDERDEAFRLIIGQANQEKSAAAYQALGTTYMAYMDFNEAVACFDLALQQNERDAKLHNNLAVALMEKEKTKAHSSGQLASADMALALEHLHRAIELDGSLLEAHFNLALCHQYQTLWRTAEEDWKKYLEKDSVSPWAEEARKNLAKVTEKIKAKPNRESIYQDFLAAWRERNGEGAWAAYKRSRLAGGSFIIHRLIDSYLSLALSGKSTEAEEYLSALLFTGNVELGKVGDRFVYDLAQFYRDAGPQQLSKLSDARSLAKAATESLWRSQMPEAINDYLRAIALFDQAGDLCESLVARSLLAHCYYQQASLDLSLPILTKGREESESRNYIWLLGQFLNGLSNVNTSMTEYSVALDCSLKQLSTSRRIEDDYGVLGSISRVTDTYLLLSRYQEILPMIQEGLSVASAINAGAATVANFHTKASECHRAAGKLLAALDYQKEAFKLGLETNNGWVISRHQALLGMIYHKLNNNAEAVNLIKESGEVGRKMGGKMGREIMAFSHLRIADVYQEMGDLDNAVKSYGDALQLYNESDINKQQMRFEAKKGMLVTHIKRGDDAAAEESLKEVIDLYEKHRQNIQDESSRNSFFDNEQGVYDIAIEYAYFKRQDPRRAFDFSEMSRARSLLDAVALPPGKLLEGSLPHIRLPRSTRPLDLGQIQSRLPGKTQLLQYSVLNDHLLIWVVSASDFRSRSIKVGREALNSKVSDYLQSLAGGPKVSQEGDYKARSSELYNLLIEPVKNLLDNGAEICIIPDKSLNRLPFASLFSSGAGKYLIEEHAILTSPSANMFIVASDRARQKEDVQSERLLSVGNPWFDRAAFRDLKDLPWAASQASEIKGFYENSVALLEKEASEPDVRNAIQKSDVVHFATHYIADERSPLLSLLPLAGTRQSALKENDGVLQTFEFYSMNLSRPRLVVLSACQTGIEQNYKGEGAIGLARPFEEAGIPLVVASLWPVESYPTKELMVAFHKHRKSDRQSTAQALRQAQLDMIRSGSPEFRKPYHWAAYTVVGGHANF
jgi:CHAT domain-containing protein/Tfp pilus assembly protein PilF